MLSSSVSVAEKIDVISNLVGEVQLRAVTRPDRRSRSCQGPRMVAAHNATCSTQGAAPRSPHHRPGSGGNRISTRPTYLRMGTRPEVGAPPDA
jgi:hypothetical protein